jgi:hypothetical protein
MGRKKPATSALSAKATARLEAVAKASYQRKKITTEVIPSDVSRAKAGAWLDLISPITEWAGLRGDALRYRRTQLRIQQEETLFRLAKAIREKLSYETPETPVPTKILVPALEKASLENPDDSYMIDRWADLLASAALGVKVEPRFVAILEELSGFQARTLELIAFNNYMNVEFPGRDFDDAPYEIGEYWISDQIQEFIRGMLSSVNDIENCGADLFAHFERPGAYVELIDIFLNRPNHFQWGPSDKEIKDTDLHVLESLSLIRRVSLRLIHKLKRPKGRQVQIGMIFFHLTELGVEFCETCCRAKVKEIKQIDEARRKTKEKKPKHWTD